MALQNRVAPTGEIVADPARGAWMGNRGILHDGAKRLGAARWRHKSWIVCRLAFKGRRRAVMAPGRYTELFFLDEASALAAGHRPCAECRRVDFERYRRALAGPHGEPLRACAIDARLHAERTSPGSRAQRRHEARAESLPDGAFVLLDDGPWLVLGERLARWRFSGYRAARPRPSGPVAVLTPPTSLAALVGGYGPEIHASALEAGYPITEQTFPSAASPSRSS